MWLFMNDSMLSIVEHRADETVLLVRARNEGDIEKVFPMVRTYTDPAADYMHRAHVPRDLVAKAIAERIATIGYDNFKNSIPAAEHERHDAYTDVWAVMYGFQNRGNARKLRSPMSGLNLPRLNENNELEM